jgi:hypothetical protein
MVEPDSPHFAIRDVSKKFGEWYQKANKTEDTNKLTLLAFRIIAILHNTLLATFISFWKLSTKTFLGIDRRTAVTRSWIAATSAKRAPFMMLFRRGNREVHRTPLIWRPQAPDQACMKCSYVGFPVILCPPKETCPYALYVFRRR